MKEEEEAIPIVHILENVFSRKVKRKFDFSGSSLLLTIIVCAKRLVAR